MRRQEHLIAIIAEEAAEVAQRATKALRFGIYEVQPGQEKNNLRRMLEDQCDLLAVVSMLLDGKVGDPLPDFNDLIEAKKKRVEKFLKYSEHCGTLDNPV